MRHTRPKVLLNVSDKKVLQIDFDPFRFLVCPFRFESAFSCLDSLNELKEKISVILKVAISSSTYNYFHKSNSHIWLLKSLFLSNFSKIWKRFFESMFLAIWGYSSIQFILNPKIFNKADHMSGFMFGSKYVQVLYSYVSSMKPFLTIFHW